MTLPAVLTTPAAKAVAITLLAVALMAVALMAGTAWLLRDQFSEGNKAAAAAVTTTVQQETIKAQENARREKEQIEEEVRSTPYDDRVDGPR